MRRSLYVAATLAALVLSVACAKGPAEAALKAADQAIETARPEIEKYVPEEFGSLTQAGQAAREKFTQGDYKAALAAAQEIPAKVQAALEAAKKKKEELTQAWSSFKASLPGMVDDFKSKVDAFAAMKKLPKGFDAAKIDAAKTQLAGITDAWKAASGAFEEGDIPGAVAKATALKTQVEQAMAGLPAPPAAKK